MSKPVICSKSPFLLLLHPHSSSFPQLREQNGGERRNFQKEPLLLWLFFPSAPSERGEKRSQGFCRLVSASSSRTRRSLRTNKGGFREKALPPPFYGEERILCNFFDKPHRIIVQDKEKGRPAGRIGLSKLKVKATILVIS